MKPTLAALCLVMVLPMLSVPVYSLAVSDVEVLSSLNQPLDARIRLLSVSQAELDSLSLSVHGDPASGQSVVALHPEVAEDENGHFIHITTRDAVREPILSITVEATWSSGRLTREYSLIIDPQ